MELKKYYTIEEAYANKEEILRKLDSLKEKNKIHFYLNDDIIYIEDIELMNYEIKDLLNFFDDMDVLPYDDEIDNELFDEDGYIDEDFIDEDIIDY